MQSIVVVDDDRGMGALMETLLLNEGYPSIRVFDRPLEAFRHVVRNGMPSLLITDNLMPDVTGVRLLEELEVLYGRVNAMIVTCDSASALQKCNQYPVVEKGLAGFNRLFLGTVALRLKLTGRFRALSPAG